MNLIFWEFVSLIGTGVFFTLAVEYFIWVIRLFIHDGKRVKKEEQDGSKDKLAGA